MLRFYSRLTVYRKNEETQTRDLDFPYKQEDVESFESEIYRLLNGVHLVDDAGNVYVFRVQEVKQLV